MAVLSCFTSTDDLYAAIHASPVVYNAFYAARKVVLVSMVAHDLGVAIRDAVAATQIATPDFKPTRGSESIDEAIEQYKRLPRGLDATRTLSFDGIVALVRINRDVQFFIDDFVAFILPDLRQMHPDAVRPLTSTERQRFAQAVLRHQVLACLDYNDHFSSDRGIPNLQKFLGLFRPWELQQLADAHGIVADAVQRANRYLWARRHPPREDHSKEAIKDVGLLRKDILADRERDPSIRTRRDEIAIPGGLPQYFPNRFFHLLRGPLTNDMLARERGPYPIPSPVELYVREDGSPPLVFHEAVDAPPFAWVDGNAGIDCQRWGGYLRREIRGDLPGVQQLTMWAYMNWWRYFGFMFWDRGRVELLKTRRAEYATGWLVADELLRGEPDYEPVEKPPARRRRRTRRVTGFSQS